MLLVFAQARRSPDCEDWDPASANATVALADIGAPALDPVLRLLHDEHELPNVRTGVVHVLSRMGDIAAPHLVATLEDTDPSVRAAAAAALARVAPHRLTRRRGAWGVPSRAPPCIPPALSGNTLGGSLARLPPRAMVAPGNRRKV